MGYETTVRKRMRKTFGLKPDAAVGTVSSFGKQQRVEDETRSVWVTATTSDIDLEKEVVVPGGADTSYFFRNRNIFVNHSYGVEDIIGKLRSAQPRSNQFGEQIAWDVHFRICPLGKSSIADDIYILAQEGGIGVSIGFEALDAGKPTRDEMLSYKQGDRVPRSIVRKWNWLELSVVGLPCNIQALQFGFGDVTAKQARDLDAMLRKRVDVVDNLLTAGRISTKTAERIGIPLSDRRKEKTISRILDIQP